MKLKKTCQNCIWCDQCGGNQVCEEFDPIDGSDQEKEYIEDLRMRGEEYQIYVDEMNGNAINLEVQCYR